MKREKPIMSFEETKRMYFPDTKAELAEMKRLKWERHWKNARGATTKEQLTNLLSNHIRLYEGGQNASGFICKADTSMERKSIIEFLQNRLTKEYAA